MFSDQGVDGAGGENSPQRGSCRISGIDVLNGLCFHSKFGAVYGAGFGSTASVPSDL